MDDELNILPLSRHAKADCSRSRVDRLRASLRAPEFTKKGWTQLMSGSEGFGGAYSVEFECQPEQEIFRGW